MSMSRRAFLQSAGAAAIVAVLPLSVQDAFAQQAQQQQAQYSRKQSIPAGMQPEMEFDIRKLRQEMNLPPGNGPFVRVPVLAKKALNSNQWTLYNVVVDASLLQKVALTEAEIQQVEKERHITIPRDRGPITQTRETVAFISQFNLEIYMTPEQMRKQIDMYRNDSDKTLIATRDSWRDDVVLKASNSQTMAGITKHLIDYHGLQQVNVTVGSTQVPLLAAVVDARVDCNDVLSGKKRGLAALVTPATQPATTQPSGEAKPEARHG